MTATASAGGFGSEQPYGGSDAAARHQALTRAAADIRVRRRANLPVEHILLIGGSILLPLGMVFVLLGWYGSAHTGHTYAQIDYLISGGLLGVTLSVAGGFMYFGYWLSRQLGESRRQSALTLQAFERLEQALEGAATASLAASYAGPDATSPTPPAGTPAVDHADWAPPAALSPVTATGVAAASTTANGAPPRTRAGRAAAAASNGKVGRLVATPRGTLLHRPECPVVARRPEVRTMPPGTEGFGYCTMCNAAGVED